MDSETISRLRACKINILQMGIDGDKHIYIYEYQAPNGKWYKAPIEFYKGEIKTHMEQIIALVKVSIHGDSEV